MVVWFFVFLSLIFGVLQAEADRVLPVFSGLWYTSETYVGLDACYSDIYSYDNQGSEPGLVAQSAFNKVGYSRTDCQWGQPNFTLEHDELLRPLYFLGNISDWLELTQKLGQPMTMSVTQDCLDSQETSHDWRQVLVFPLYRCPPGSSSRVSGTPPESGCFTTPHVCSADVVGRDLDIPLLGPIGHVGMIMAGDPVIGAV